jgi:hypothetical protein
MDAQEIKLRLVEAAAKNPTPHPDGFAAGVLETTRLWFEYVNSEERPAAGNGGKSALQKR